MGNRYYLGLILFIGSFTGNTQAAWTVDGDEYQSSNCANGNCQLIQGIVSAPVRIVQAVAQEVRPTRSRVANTEDYRYVQTATNIEDGETIQIVRSRPVRSFFSSRPFRSFFQSRPIRSLFRCNR